MLTIDLSLRDYRFYDDLLALYGYDKSTAMQNFDDLFVFYLNTAVRVYRHIYPSLCDYQIDLVSREQKSPFELKYQINLINAIDDSLDFNIRINVGLEEYALNNIKGVKDLHSYFDTIYQVIAQCIERYEFLLFYGGEL